MQKDLGNYRKSYEKNELDEGFLREDPMEQFRLWFQEQEASKGVEEPNAMTVSTLGLDGYPKSRIVLLKQFDDRGFVFFTNYKSEKGRAIAANPAVCLSFFWPNLERQVIIKGRAEKLSAVDSDAYFDSRPFGSRLGALVSPQSEVIASRGQLEEDLRALEEGYRDKEVHRPDHWGGYLVRPVTIEFWQGRSNRLHDRIRYGRQGDSPWKIERLAP